MLPSFRFISLLEGISYLIILSVTLGFISRDFVFVLGAIHGLLFLIYFIFSLLLLHKQHWSVLTWLAILFAAVIPFAFIAVDLFLRKQTIKS